MLQITQPIRLKQSKSEGGGDIALPLCSAPGRPLSISSPISSTHKTISCPRSTQSSASSSLCAPSPLSTPIHKTPISSIYATLPPSASPITTWGLSPCFTSPTSGTRSTVTVIVLSTVRPPPCTMSDPGTITLVPVDPTSIIIYPPGTAQSGLSTSTPIIISSTPFVIPASTFRSTTFLSPIPSTSDSLSPTVIPHPSISAISVSSVSSADDATVTPTSASADGRQTTTFSTAVETGVLSTDTPHDSGFAHQAGAIVGVTLGGSFVLLSIILLIFFTCKQHYWRRSYTSSTENILAVSRNTSWRPPLEDDDHLGPYGVPMSPDPSILLPHSSHDGSLRPWWFPANSDQRINPQRLPPTVDSHISAAGSRSASSSVLGGGGSSSNVHHIPGETPLPISIPPTYRPSGRSGYFTLPTPSRDSSIRIQEEQEKHDRVNNRISQAIMARLRAGRRPSATAPIRAYSHSTAIGSEVSQAPSYPIISMPQTDDIVGSSYTPHVYGERLWPSVTLPPTPSPAPTHSPRMVEGLLDPVTIRSPQASTASFQDRNDYSRRFNGCLVNDHFQSTTTVDLCERRA